MPVITVIIPVYNVELYLERCLDSLIAQTFRDFEVILIDDGSSDGSSNICDAYLKRDSRFRVFHIDNGGVSRARNIALRKARGMWVTFVDSDDWIEQDMLERLYGIAISGEYDIVMSNFILDRQGSTIVTRSVPDFITKRNIPSYPLAVLVEDCARADGVSVRVESLCAACGKLTNMQLIRDWELYFAEDLQLNEDGLFHLSCFFHAKDVAITNQAYYHYCIRSSSSNMRYRPDVHEQNVVSKKRFDKISCNVSDILRDDYASLAAYRRYLALHYLYLSHVDNQSNFTERITELRRLLLTGIYDVISIPASLPWFKKLEMLLLRHKQALLLMIVARYRQHNRG